MYHRAIHDLGGEISLLDYGKAGDAIWSVSRSGINEQLLDLADDEPLISTHFEHRLIDIDFQSANTTFSYRIGEEFVVDADFAFGADGQTRRCGGLRTTSRDSAIANPTCRNAISS